MAEEHKVFPAKVQIHQGRDTNSKAVQFSPASGDVQESKDRKFILNVSCCSSPAGDGKFDWKKGVNFGLSLGETILLYAAVKSLGNAPTCKDGKQAFIHGMKSLNVEKGQDGQSIRIGFTDRVNGNGAVMAGIKDGSYWALLFLLEYTIYKSPSVMGWGPIMHHKSDVLDQFSWYDGRLKIKE